MARDPRKTFSFGCYAIAGVVIPLVVIIVMLVCGGVLGGFEWLGGWISSMRGETALVVPADEPVAQNMSGPTSNQ